VAEAAMTRRVAATTWAAEAETTLCRRVVESENRAADGLCHPPAVLSSDQALTLKATSRSIKDEKAACKAVGHLPLVNLARIAAEARDAEAADSLDAAEATEVLEAASRKWSCGSASFTSQSLKSKLVGHRWP
jgi:hypothetical protein